MKDLSSAAKVYILSTTLISFGLIGWMMITKLDWTNLWLYVLAALGGVAQTFKAEGPNERTNYSIAWFVYGFTFIALGPTAALFVVVISHLMEWIWHQYPWYIQSFNIGAHCIPLYLASLVSGTFNQDPQALDLYSATGLVAANLIFVCGNHFLVGLVVNLARGQSFAESGVFGFLTLLLDFTVLSMGAATALIWHSTPFASVLNILPLYLLYNSIRVPALRRRLEEMKALNLQMQRGPSGD